MIFCLLGTIKLKVYSTKVWSHDKLVQRIKNAVPETQRNFQKLRNIIISIVHRCQACTRAQGQRFEMKN